MDAFVTAVDAPIAPFMEPARDASVGGARLQDYTRQLLHGLGFDVTAVPAAAQIAPRGPCLVLPEDLFLSRRALRGFVRLARKRGGVSRLALPQSLLMERFHLLQGLARDAEGRFLFDAFFFAEAPRDGDALRAAMDAAAPLVPPFRELRYQVPIPRSILGAERYEHPVTTTIALRVRHWVHILWLNNLWPQIQLVERITSSPLGTAWRLIGSAGLTRGSMFHRAMRRFVYRGRRCRVHPTARVELSILGDDVEIGAYALVRGSVVGSGTTIEDRANVVHSTLGPRTFVSRNSTLVMCASYPDADMCVNGMQFSLAGRRAALTSFVRVLDMAVGGPVSVLDQGRPVPLPGHMLGACFGHGAFVGPDVMILPGRAIPCGARILPPPEQALARVPETWPEGQRGVIRDGRLVPMGDPPA